MSDNACDDNNALKDLGDLDRPMSKVTSEYPLWLNTLFDQYLSLYITNVKKQTQKLGALESLKANKS